MYLASLENIGLLLLMAVPGFLIAKLKLINRDGAVSFLSVLLLYVCQPFVTFNSFLNTAYRPEILTNIIVCFVFTAALLCLMMVLGNLLMRFLEKDVFRRGIYVYGGAFGNIGYLCVPFLQILMPGNTEILLYASTAIVSFNLTAWTVGNFALTREKKHVSLKHALLNPTTLSFIVALPLFLCNVNFIGQESLAGLQNLIRLFAQMVGPLAMLMLGIKFADVKLKELFTDYKLFATVGIKLILSPVISFALVLLLSTFMDVSAIRLNLIAIAAMPAANNLLMFCSLHGKDTMLAARVIMLSTLLSVATIPLALTLFV